MKVSVEFEKGDEFRLIDKVEISTLMTDSSDAAELLKTVIGVMPVGRSAAAFWLLLDVYNETGSTLANDDFSGLEDDIEKLIQWIRKEAKLPCTP